MKEQTVLLVKERSSPKINNFVLLQELIQRGFYTKNEFTFVGIYYSCATKTTVIGYPKYLCDELSDEDKIEHVNLVCRVIEKASSSLRDSLVEDYNFDAYKQNKNCREVNKYNLASYILKDYMEHGIYYIKSKKQVNNGNGNINWGLTVSKVLPVIDREVLYLETINSVIRCDFSQLLTALHIWIVNSCAKLLQGLGQYKNIELPDIIEVFDEDTIHIYSDYILKKLPFVFSDREILLLKALSAWCKSSRFYKNQMGITAFDIIWEYATNCVFGNVEDTSSGPPIYNIKGKKYNGTGKSIPDILRVFADENGKQKGYICIFDAKYFFPGYDFMKDSDVRGLPRDSDISKQINYYNYMKQKYHPREGVEIKFSNAFLIPNFIGENNNLYENIGVVYKNNHFNNTNEINHLLNNIVQVDAENNSPNNMDFIMLFQINPTLLYEQCLKGYKVDEEDIIKDFIKPFQRAFGTMV